MSVAYLYWGKTEDEKLGGKDTVPLRTIPVEDTDPSWPAGTFVHESAGSAAAAVALSSQGRDSRRAGSWNRSRI